MTELTLTTGPAANGGSCVARHDGRVVFVRYALPGETVRVKVLDERPGDEHRKAAEMAVKYCPTHAIALIED